MSASSVPTNEVDQRAAAVTEGALDNLLQFDVDRQHQVVAGIRWLARQCTDRTAARSDLDFLAARRPMQIALVALLDAHLADVIRAGIYVRIASLLGRLLRRMEASAGTHPELTENTS